LESQFLYDAPARLVSVEVADADCLRTKVAERVTNSCVCRLRRHALSGVFGRHPVSGLIDVWLTGNIQRGSDDEIPVDPVESGQCDSCLTLVIHRSSNRVFHRLPRPLVVEGPGHPTLQIGPRLLFGRLNRIQIAKSWRAQDQARRDDRHQMAHNGYPELWRYDFPPKDNGATRIHLRTVTRGRMSGFRRRLPSCKRGA